MNTKQITREDLLKDKPLIIAGPCAVESREQILSLAEKLHKVGIRVMRCQLWKPRTEPESFQGISHDGLDWIREVKKRYGMIISTEIVDSEQIERTTGVTDILWIGSRNMQNYELLKKAGKDGRPVILKRGFISTIPEWMGAAKYIGLDNVILCERGIRTGADSMRFTLDINTALVIKHDQKMPIIIDPSHTAGRRDMVEHLAYAATAAGVDGLVIEVHEEPEKALSDSAQQVTPETFAKIYKKAHQIYKLVHSK